MLGRSLGSSVALPQATVVCTAANSNDNHPHPRSPKLFIVHNVRGRNQPVNQRRSGKRGFTGSERNGLTYTQRTRVLSSGRELERGLLAGFSWNTAYLTRQLLNPDDAKPIVIAAVGGSFVR